MHGGFGEAELSGNDAYTVTLPMQLSNFLAMDTARDPKSHDCGSAGWIGLESLDSMPQVSADIRVSV
jgi:hypothetical protein